MSRTDLHAPKRKKIDFRKAEIGLLIFGILFTVPPIFLAIFYPVKALPLYGKFIGFGLFALGFYWCLRRERTKAKE